MSGIVDVERFYEATCKAPFVWANSTSMSRVSAMHMMKAINASTKHFETAESNFESLSDLMVAVLDNTDDDLKSHIRRLSSVAQSNNSAYYAALAPVAIVSDGIESLMVFKRPSEAKPVVWMHSEITDSERRIVEKLFKAKKLSPIMKEHAEMLGKGGAGVVYKMKNANLVVKLVKKTEMASEVEGTCYIADSVGDSNLFSTPIAMKNIGMDGMGLIVYQYCGSQTLESHLQNLQREEEMGAAELAKLMHSCALATLQLTGKAGLVHNDAYPKNVCWDGYNLVFIDFGLIDPLENSPTTALSDLFGMALSVYIANSLNSSSHHVWKDIFGALLFAKGPNEKLDRSEENILKTLMEEIDQLRKARKSDFYLDLSFDYLQLHPDYEDQINYNHLQAGMFVVLKRLTLKNTPWNLSEDKNDVFSAFEKVSTALEGVAKKYTQKGTRKRKNTSY